MFHNDGALYFTLDSTLEIGKRLVASPMSPKPSYIIATGGGRGRVPVSLSDQLKGGS